MFERFTDRARRAIVLASEEARRRDSEVDADYLLFGIVEEGSGVAAKVLSSFATLEAIRGHVLEELPEGQPVPGKTPFTRGAKAALEGSLRIALELGHHYIGTEHLLLALLRTEGRPARVLREAGVDYTTARSRVLKILSEAAVPPDISGLHRFPSSGDETEG
jgi:ATP-dependent Clp protease ATP-binding subunit ClpC